MIYHLISLGTNPIPPHQLLLSTCHRKIEQVFDNHRQQWDKVCLINFTGRHRTDLNKDKQYPLLSFDDIMRNLGCGIIVQCFPTTNWKEDRKKCLAEFDLYYHNCLTARALTDIFGIASILSHYP